MTTSTELFGRWTNLSADSILSTNEYGVRNSHPTPVSKLDNTDSTTGDVQAQVDTKQDLLINESNIHSFQTHDLTTPGDITPLNVDNLPSGVVAWLYGFYQSSFPTPSISKMVLDPAYSSPTTEKWKLSRDENIPFVDSPNIIKRQLSLSRSFPSPAPEIVLSSVDSDISLVHRMLRDPSGNYALIGNTDIWFSGNAGTTWLPSSSVPGGSTWSTDCPSLTSFAYFFSLNGRFVAGNQLTYEVWYSDDYGRSWQQSPASMAFVFRGAVVSEGELLSFQSDSSYQYPITPGVNPLFYRTSDAVTWTVETTVPYTCPSDGEPLGNFYDAWFKWKGRYYFSSFRDNHLVVRNNLIYTTDFVTWREVFDCPQFNYGSGKFMSGGESLMLWQKNVPYYYWTRDGVNWFGVAQSYGPGTTHSAIWVNGFLDGMLVSVINSNNAGREFRYATSLANNKMNFGGSVFTWPSGFESGWGVVVDEISRTVYSIMKETSTGNFSLVRSSLLVQYVPASGDTFDFIPPYLTSQTVSPPLYPIIKEIT